MDTDIHKDLRHYTATWNSICMGLNQVTDELNHAFAFTVFPFNSIKHL
jgi:hypothetical protein